MLEEVLPVYIARLDIPASHMCAQLSAVHVQLMWMNAPTNRRYLELEKLYFYTNPLYLFKEKNHSILNISYYYLTTHEVIYLSKYSF